MSVQWYYANQQHEQCGPVDAAALKDAFQRRELSAESLVWREGMAEWQPLATQAEELGLVMPLVATGRGSAATWIGALVALLVLVLAGLYFSGAMAADAASGKVTPVGIEARGPATAPFSAALLRQAESHRAAVLSA